MIDGPPYLAELGRQLRKFLKLLLNGNFSERVCAAWFSKAIVCEILAENGFTIKKLQKLGQRHEFREISLSEIDQLMTECRKSNFQSTLVRKLRSWLSQGDTWNVAYRKALSDAVASQLYVTIEICREKLAALTAEDIKGATELSSVIKEIDQRQLEKAVEAGNTKLFDLATAKETSINDGPPI